MIGVKSKFTKKQLDYMEKSIGLVISDTKDYSDDEIADMYFLVTEELPYEFDRDGEPLEKGKLFEDIIDVFYRHYRNII